ncbi:hypothetical protein EV175_001417 [Coemansia sp. RSA 1933]|nr:hypothetical protein EV175_001417 [Coemansia sp. RSA 1933]
MAPSKLINVREFRDKYAGLVRSQKDHGLFNAQSEWSEETKREVAERCRIDDDLCFSNTAFVNPTLFHMLRQHREFNEATERELLQKKREEAAELEKRRQDRSSEQHDLTALTEDLLYTNSIGADRSMLLAVDVDNGNSGGAGRDELGSQAMDVDATTVEDALARLASSAGAIGEDVLRDQAENNAEGHSDTGNVDSNSAQEEKGHQNGSGLVDTSGSQAAENDEIGRVVTSKSNGSTQKGPTDKEAVADETYNSGSEIESDGSYLSVSSFGDEDMDNESNTSANIRQPVSAIAALKSRTRKPEEITLFTPASELPRGITQDMLKQAIANSGFARSSDVAEETKRVVKQRTRVEEPAGVSELECKFRKVKDLLDESTLASLRKANRRMVPPKYRLEVNFLTNRVQPGSVPDATPVSDDEVLLSVCFYNTRSSTSKMEEYLVLGSQNLTVLRDSFYCISDFLFSHRDEQIENTKDKKVSSSYFFIEKTFYNDMRSPTATDYSRVIMEWANDPARQANNPKLQGLQSRLMDGARFLDLSIRLKQPYLFVHQGDCEHVMMFTDMRLLGPKDDQFVENYPKQIFRTRHMRHKCRMCSAYPAQYVTKNDFHSGMSPCYFCEKCYTPFHFDDDGKKLLEHDVFPYANVNLM